MILALLLLLQDSGSGGEPKPLPSGPRRQWRVGSGLDRKFGFYSMSVRAAFLWVPKLDLDVTDSGVEFLDKHFFAPGGLLIADLGHIEPSFGLYGGAFSGTARSGGQDVETDGDLLAIRVTAYCPVVEFNYHFWRISFGPTAGGIGLFESVEAVGGAPADHNLVEWGATVGVRGAIDYKFGSIVFFTFQAGGSWILGESIGGWMPEIAFGFGVEF